MLVVKRKKEIFPCGTNLLFSRRICPLQSGTSLERFWKHTLNSYSVLRLRLLSSEDKRPVPNNPKPVIVVAVRRVVIVAISRTAVVIVVVPRAAPQNPRTWQTCPLIANIGFFENIFNGFAVVLLKKGKKIKEHKVNRSEQPETRYSRSGTKGRYSRD